MPVLLPRRDEQTITRLVANLIAMKINLENTFENVPCVPFLTPFRFNKIHCEFY